MLEQKISKLIEGLGGRINKLAPDTKLTNIGLDSLHKVELAVDIEIEFGVEISDDDAENMQTFGDVIELVKRKTQVAASA